MKAKIKPDTQDITFLSNELEFCIDLIHSRLLPEILVYIVTGKVVLIQLAFMTTSFHELINT